MSLSPLVVEVALLSNAIPVPLSYRVPEALAGQVRAGMAVIVPLRNRLVAGIVTNDQQPDPPITFALRDVHALVDERPALNPGQLSLARWMSREYHAPLGRCCALMVPPGFTPSSAYVYVLADDEGRASATDPSAALRAGDGRRMSGANVVVPSSVDAQVIDVLRRRGPLLESKLRSALRGVKGGRAVLKALVKKGVVRRESTLQPLVVKPLRTTLAQLAVSAATLDIVLDNLEQEAVRAPRRAQAMSRRANVLLYLQQRNGLAWADWVFAETGANRADLTWLAERDYVLLGDAERWRDPLADIDYVAATAPPLTEDQARAWEAVRRQMVEQGEDNRTQNTAPSTQHLGHSHFLLRGVTGSGKTEVYMRAVELALQQGRGALVLVPEISLTPQTARRFLARFPGKVALIHSRLKPGERFDTWRRIRSGELSVVVGARSALFAPLPDVGVIVLDEEHDASYKQSAPPYYDTRRVAMRYAEQCGATLIMGSATPSLEAWYAASQTPADAAAIGSVGGRWPIRVLELPNRVRGHVTRLEDQQARLGVRTLAQRETAVVAYQPLPLVQVIDMRAELRGGNKDMFSGALRLALGETLQRGEQAILFLNRRGTASCVICRDCGFVARCPNDDVPLTYHESEGPTDDARRTTDDGRLAGPMVNRQSRADNQKVAAGSSKRQTMKDGKPKSVLKCHQCDHVERVPAKCPACGRGRIRFVGIGTQKVAQSVSELFPSARVVRWDKDASAASGQSSADQLLQRFVNRQADVLVGTQMIAKGLDLPLVTLVGVVLADVGMFLPDFRAGERVFDLIEQVAGRAGRGLLSGRVIVQTYNPDHPAIAFAARHDVAGFARYELAQRKRLDLPPFTRLVRFELADEDDAVAQRECETLARQLRRRAVQPSDVIGPAQAYFTRHDRRYRWHIFVRTERPGDLLDNLEVPRGCIVDVDPISVL
jgi:primosomal protein N' (replication factor Y) (superfamily II helicase)